MGGMVKKMAKKLKAMKMMAKKAGRNMDMKEGMIEFMMNMAEMDGGDGDNKAKYMLKKLLGKKKSMEDMMEEIPKEVKALMKVAMDIFRETSGSSEEEDDSMEDEYSMEDKCSMEE